MPAFTVSPIFVVTKICDLDLSDLPEDLRRKTGVDRVTAGICSMNTRPMLVESKTPIDAADLEELRRELRDEMKYPCKPKPGGQTA